MSEWPFKVLVKYASRSRPQRFFDGLDNIFETCEFPDRILVMCTLDSDDPTMNNDEVKERLSKYKYIDVNYGISGTKIRATNRDLNKVPEHFKDWDILCNFSDDMKWTEYAWDTMIRRDFNFVSSDFSHYMAYLDPDTGGSLSTLFISGRTFFDKFKFIYDEIFESLFADNLVEDCAKAIGKYHYTGYQIYQHFNPSYGYVRYEEDEMYREQQTVGWTKDQQTYNEIISKGIPEYLKQFDL